MTLRTALCRLVGIDLPIVQAPMGNAAGPALAAGVSNAGGLGMLAVTWRRVDDARAVIRETAAETDAPFGANVVVDPDAKRIPTGDHVDACLDEGVEVISFSFGSGAPYVDRVHDASGIVMQSVGSAAEAREAVDAGVDAVVAQGWEAGGHVEGEVATLPLVPRVVDAVPDVPVVAAGGIADGRGIAAVLALGAAGAWIGTRFLATDEAVAHRVYKRAVVEAAETDTVYSELFDRGWPGVPHRTLRNHPVEEWEDRGHPSAGDRPGEDRAVAAFPDGTPIERYSAVFPQPGMTGDLDELALYAGQSVGLVSELGSAGELVAALADETIDALDALDAVHPSG